MRKNIILQLIIGVISFSSCSDLDLTPLAKGTNENWFSNEKEITMALNDSYHHNFWPLMQDIWTDDEIYRDQLNPFLTGTLNGQTNNVTTVWANSYKAIARMNTVITSLERLPEGAIMASKKDQLLGEALFMRACRYADLISLYGDVPYVTEIIDIDEAFYIGRTAKEDIKKATYADFDKAIDLLPVSSSSLKRLTRGAAYAMKARLALYNGDWEIVKKATEACMGLSYKLYPEYGRLFVSTTHDTEESIFSLPRSITANISKFYSVPYLCRNVGGGWASNEPTWDLLAGYTCTDGLPIDESPLFDPHDPFKNRDPRCCETIVPFNTVFLGVTYAPHPDSLQVYNTNTGKWQTNNDNKANTQYASYNALIRKKGFDESCLQNGGYIEQDRIIIRYADVLLMYAEAKIELNEIDESVLNAINQVRARAYGVDVSATDQYPVVTEMNQAKLRTILRMERRMEFAFEGLRYMDLIRWKLNDKVMNMKNYGILYPADLLRDKVTSKGHWFWSVAPDIDENGLADFSEMEKTGLINPLSQRSFDERQYLWPIPSKEILINENIKQNPGY